MKKYFLTGLVTLLPVAVTLWIVLFIVHFLTRPFVGIVTHFLKQAPSIWIFASEKGIQTLSEILILISLLILTLFLGLIGRRYFFDTLLKIGDNILHKIPIVNKIYKTSKEIISSLFATDGNSFKQVVLINFPSKDSYCLGLIAGDAPDTCIEQAQEKLISVFIPTTPNPMTGYVVMMPKKELTFLKMTTEEAIKYVVSCAVIQPQTPSGE